MGNTRHQLLAWLVVVALLAFQPTTFARTVSDSAIVSDKVISRIDDGDSVLPVFSPDGKQLAYVRTIVKRQTELTEVYVRDLSSGADWLLLGAETSRKYAVYKAFVYNLEWASNDRLVASVSDGDVGTTLVEFDVGARRIISERQDKDLEAVWYAEIEKRMRAVKKLPDWDPDIVQNAFENSVELQDGSFLIQPQYAGVAPDVFHITQQGRLTRLTQLDKDANNALCGGVQLRDSLLFLLAESRTGNSRQANLLRYRDGRIEKLASVATLTEPELVPLRTRQARALFFVSTGYPYQRSPGVLYEYASEQLRSWPPPNTLHRVSADSSGRKVSLVMWENDRRIIEVREIKAGNRDK
ncbi:MAG: hypothetical protein JSU95_19065 [Betaproteobacteria bacterium]|nr:MAG: hypothetical protein JSU95_19065 [Betaproteobacteria bacterium]